MNSPVFFCSSNPVFSLFATFPLGCHSSGRSSMASLFRDGDFFVLLFACAIQKRNERTKRNAHHTCYYDFAGGQTMMPRCVSKAGLFFSNIRWKKNRQLPTAGDNRPCIRSIVSPGGWLEEAQQQQASNGQKCLAASSQNKWRGKEEENGIVGEQGRRMLTSSVDHATHAQPSRLLRSKKTKTLDKDAART